MNIRIPNGWRRKATTIKTLARLISLFAVLRVIVTFAPAFAIGDMSKVNLGGLVSILDTFLAGLVASLLSLINPAKADQPDKTEEQ